MDPASLFASGGGSMAFDLGATAGGGPMNANINSSKTFNSGLSTPTIALAAVVLVTYFYFKKK